MNRRIEPGVPASRTPPERTTSATGAILAVALLCFGGGSAFADELTVRAICERRTAEFKAPDAAFKKLEDAKDSKGRYPPVDTPPNYHWACRGESHYADRDANEEQDLQRYLDQMFFTREKEVVFALMKAAALVLDACGSDSPAEVTSARARIGKYYQARLRSMVKDALAEQGSEKYVRFWPLIRAGVGLERAGDLSADYQSDKEEGGLVVTPLMRALFAEQVRLLTKEHDLRITPRVIFKLARDAGLVGIDLGSSADAGELVRRLWRFKVEASNRFIFREGENDLGNVEIEAQLKDFIVTKRLIVNRRDEPDLALAHFEPTEANFRNTSVDYNGAKFVGPARFASNIDLGFDPCAPDPAAYFSITDLASKTDTVLVPGEGGDPPHEEKIRSPAYDFAAEVMEKRAESEPFQGLPGSVFKLRLRGQNEEVVNETISETLRREDQAMLVNELRVVVKHVPLSIEK